MLDANQVVMVGAILAEVLQGTRDEGGFAQLRSWLEVLPYVEPEKDTWIRTAELSVTLRSQGQLTPLMDLLIAALALELGHQVYTLDEHFQRVPGLRLYEAKTG